MSLFSSRCGSLDLQTRPIEAPPVAGLFGDRPELGGKPGKALRTVQARVGALSTDGEMMGGMDHASPLAADSKRRRFRVAVVLVSLAVAAAGAAWLAIR